MLPVEEDKFEGSNNRLVPSVIALVFINSVSSTTPLCAMANVTITSSRVAAAADTEMSLHCSSVVNHQHLHQLYLICHG